MANNYNQPGDVIEYTATANIASGAIVLMGRLAGVALGPIANGATGPVAISGVFTLPKAGTFTASQGALVYASSGEVTDAETNNAPIGALVTATGEGDTSCRVKLNVALPAIVTSGS